MSLNHIVLFLCTGNSARSQMAEGLMRKKTGTDFEVHSAGIEPAPSVHPLAVAAMREIGIDISSQRPKSVKDYLGRLPVRHLIIVCDDANEKCPAVFPGVITRDFWPVENPAAFEGTEEAKLDAFRAARDEISARIDRWLAEKGGR